MQENMIEHTTQRILAISSLGGQFYSFGDGGTQAALIIGIAGDDIATGSGRHGGRSNDGCPVTLHNGAAIRFLFVADLNHIHCQFQSVEAASVRKSSSPLTGSRFGGHIGHSFFFAIIGLRNGCIEFVRTHGADAFVFEIDVSRRI